MTAAVLAPSRRSFLAGGASLAALSLAGCATQRMQAVETPQFSDYYLSMYGPLPNEKFPVPAIDLTKLDPNMFRTEVPDPTGEQPGTIVVNTSERHLYLVQEGGQAIRYGVGIGKEGFAWSGTAHIAKRAEWPAWYPPQEMVERAAARSQFIPYRIDGGELNPLGARALYLYEGGRDTLYRIHGTNEPRSIGRNVSSGCIRLLNEDIIDLYNRVALGAKVIVQ